MALFSTRIDTGAMHRYLLSSGYPLLFPIVSTLCDHAVDVLAAQRCKPTPGWINVAQATLEQLLEDVARLNECESAFAVEVSREYDFTPAPTEESQGTDREPELAEQTA